MLGQVRFVEPEQRKIRHTLVPKGINQGLSCPVVARRVEAGFEREWPMTIGDAGLQALGQRHSCE